MIVASLKNQLVQSIDPVLYESNINKTHKENHFTYGLSVIPHPSKRAKGGEDSYYINEKYKKIELNFQTKNNYFHFKKSIIAIADGVGGWNDVGIDPAKYSRELCNK